MTDLEYDLHQDLGTTWNGEELEYVLGYDCHNQTYAVVSWDGTDWSDDNCICYNVDYWAELPKIKVGQ